MILIGDASDQGHNLLYDTTRYWNASVNIVKLCCHKVENKLNALSDMRDG